MKFARKVFTYGTLCVWFIYKMMLFHFSIGHCLDQKDEYISYIFNAIIILFAFMSLEKHTYTHWGKSLLSTATSAIFVASIGAENYFYQSLRFVTLGWYDWDSFFFARKGINHYLSTGEPGYHWAFLAMLAICILTIIVHAKTKDIIFPIKKWLVEKAISTRKSIYFDLTLRGLLPHIAILDYLELRDVYLNEEIKCSFFHEEITEDEFNDIELMLDYKLKRSARIYRDVLKDVSLEVSEDTSDVDANESSSDDNTNNDDA